MLYRGLLQNILDGFKDKGIKLLKRKISVPVIISAILFGLSHLILLKSGKNNDYVIGVVISAILVGIIAGYYQEKNKNHFHAILAHMSANFVGLLGALFMSSMN